MTENDQDTNKDNQGKIAKSDFIELLFFIFILIPSLFMLLTGQISVWEFLDGLPPELSTLISISSICIIFYIIAVILKFINKLIFGKSTKDKNGNHE